MGTRRRKLCDTMYCVFIVLMTLTPEILYIIYQLAVVYLTLQKLKLVNEWKVFRTCVRPKVLSPYLCSGSYDNFSQDSQSPNRDFKIEPPQRIRSRSASHSVLVTSGASGDTLRVSHTIIFLLYSLQELFVNVTI